VALISSNIEKVKYCILAVFRGSLLAHDHPFIKLPTILLATANLLCVPGIEQNLAHHTKETLSAASENIITGDLQRGLEFRYGPSV
jgi:hypothetical protein